MYVLNGRKSGIKKFRVRAVSLTGTLALLIASLGGAVPLLTQTAFAIGDRVVCSAPAPTCTDATVQSAVTNASAGDTIDIQSDQTITSSIAINKKLTIESTNGSTITTTGSDYVFNVQAGADGTTISHLNFVKSDSAGNTAMLTIDANDVQISENHFSGQYMTSADPTTRGLEVSGVSGITISGNSFTNLRQPAYINNATGTVTNNYTAHTRGWVVVSESNITFTGNTWGTGADRNAVDIAIVKDNPVGVDNYLTDLIATSNANNQAVIEDQAPSTPVMSDVFVDDSAAAGGNGYPIAPYQTISPAISRAVSGGRIHVAAGTYSESVTVNKALTLDGAQAGNDARSGRADASAESALNGNFKITSDNVTVDGFTITSANPININGGSSHNTNEAVKNNIVNVSGGTGISLNSDSTTISQNKFSMTNGIAIVASNNPWKDMSITNNAFTGTSYLDINFIGSKSYDATNPANAINTDVTVSGNTSDTHTSNFLMSTFIDGFTISNNHITDKTGSAIVLGGNDSNVTITGNTVGTTGSAVTSYQYTDSGHPGWPAWPANGKITVNHNDFSGSATGVNIAQGSVDASDSPVNATGNWWGAVNGPKDTISGDSSIPETNPSGSGAAALGAVKYGAWCTVADCSLNSSSTPGQATDLHAKFQYDSSNVADGTYLSYTAKSGGNNLELLWSAPDGLVTGYHILATYPDGSQHTFYQGPNTNAWLAAYDGFGQHGNGKYVYQVVSVNGNGTSAPSSGFTLYYDNTKPTVAFTAPTPSANSYQTGNFDIGYTASDNVALKSVNVSLYDTDSSHSNHWVATCYANGSEAGATDFGTCTVHIPASTPDGKYYIQVGAQDRALNWSVNQTRTIYIDRATLAAPTLNSPQNNAVVNGASITNSWSSVSGADKYEYESFNSSNTSGTPRYDATFAGTSKTATNVADGTVFYWRVRAIDQYGKPGSWSDLWKVTVDSTAPAAQITAPGNNLLSGTVTISGTVTDTNPDHYYLVIKNSSGHIVAGPGTVNSATVHSYSWDTTKVADGTYTIDLESRDAAGNKDAGSTATKTVIVDNTAPDTPAANPAAGDYNGTQSVELSSDDAGSGVASIYYTIDGSTPDSNSTPYAGPISVSVDTTIKAIAYDNAGNASAVFTAAYGIAPVISGEGSIDVTTSSITLVWTTNEPATSRVIYDTAPHSSLGSGPNYGYAFSTAETDTSPKVTSHSVTITGLTPGTKYYFRTVSHGSPESVSTELSSITKAPSSNGSTTPTFVITPVLNVSTTAGQFFGTATVGGSGGTGTTGNVLGASTTTPNDSDGSGHVKGDSTTVQNQKDETISKSSNLLGLGWWWLPVIVVLSLVIGGLLRRAGGTEKSS
jgi:hypothetical protein